MTMGLPGSGKDFWCRQLMDEHPNVYKRVNKDDLRQLLDLGKWSRQNEKFILTVRDAIVSLALDEGFSVICTDTNLSEKHEVRLREIADKYGVDLEIKDFTDIPIETCIERDLQRSSSVGEKVIRDMYNQFLKPKPEVYIPPADKPMALLVDIDGTLALLDGRNPYERDFINDRVNDPVRKVVNNFHKDGYIVILVSGRKNKFLEETKQWLAKNAILYDDIFMPRTDDDNRKDVIIKQEIFDTFIRNNYQVEFVLDDRPAVITMWREKIGLFVFDCNQLDIDF